MEIKFYMKSEKCMIYYYSMYGKLISILIRKTLIYYYYYTHLYV